MGEWLTGIFLLASLAFPVLWWEAVNCRGEFGRRRPGHKVEFCFRSRGWSSRDNGCQGEEVEESGDLHGDMMIARISLVSVGEV